MKARKTVIFVMMLALMLSPLAAAQAAKSAPKKTTQTERPVSGKTTAKPAAKPAQKPASTKTTAKPAQKPAPEKIALPQEEPKAPVQEEGWWNRTISAADFSYDVYFRSMKNRDADFSVGGGINLGLRTDHFKFEFYGLGDYFLKPLGGEGGAAVLEFMVEPGVMFAWKFLDVWKTNTFLCLDLGYFMQFAAIPTQPDKTFLANNGIMARVKLMTEFKIAKYYDISLGLFYQLPLYPVYDEYKGLGAMISIC